MGTKPNVSDHIDNISNRIKFKISGRKKPTVTLIPSSRSLTQLSPPVFPARKPASSIGLREAVALFLEVLSFKKQADKELYWL